MEGKARLNRKEEADRADCEPKEIRIEGMRCVNCQNRVTEALNED